MPQPVEKSPAFVGPPVKLDFEFKGAGKEYFRIWITNTLLSICTLGIYSAWAKVRKKQYLYANTYLNGHAFEYTGDPKKILKGRIVAVSLLAAYYLAMQFSVWIFLVVLLAFAFIYPWLWIRSYEFNARNSSYRNIRFGFHGGYWGAFKVYTLGAILGLLSLGVLLPFVFCKQQEYLVNHTSFGTTRFKLHAVYRDYYKAALEFLVFGIFMAVAWLMIIALGMSMIELSGEILGKVPYGYIVRAMLWGLYIITSIGISSFITSKLMMIRFKKSTLGQHRIATSINALDYIGIVAGNILNCIFTLGLYQPYARIRLNKFILSNISLLCESGLERFTAGEKSKGSSIADGVADLWDFDVSL
jgi:uncharacterized membrane protein YjgN (DUF898 family)